MAKKSMWRKSSDPIAFALTESQNAGNRFVVRVYVHLRQKKVWSLYETTTFTDFTLLDDYLKRLYPGITNLRIDKL